MGKARTFDPTAGFSLDLVMTGLRRLYMIDGGKLLPNLDSMKIPPACPITLNPFEDPVLLEDGFVYEQAAIVHWLERNVNAPCTNKEVRNHRVLRLDPFRAVVSRFLEESPPDELETGWKAQLLKVEKEANCSSTPLPVRCARVEQAIDACEEEFVELQEALEAARCTANRLQAELRCQQEEASVKLQRTIRCWLARRELRRLEQAWAKGVLHCQLRVDRARNLFVRLRRWRLFAVVRIQRWWKGILRRRAKKAKRLRARLLKQQQKVQELQDGPSTEQFSADPPNTPGKSSADPPSTPGQASGAQKYTASSPQKSRATAPRKPVGLLLRERASDPQRMEAFSKMSREERRRALAADLLPDIIRLNPAHAEEIKRHMFITDSAEDLELMESAVRIKATAAALFPE